MENQTCENNNNKKKQTPQQFLISLLCLVSLQMVVVSDDVHEYAVALKDTEEKIARCPARVSRAQSSRSFFHRR